MAKEDKGNDSFDQTYEKNDKMFGHVYKELQDFFLKYPHKGSVLDLGCGQGRDALFLASVGYDVTAVDSSKVGIRQMLMEADNKGVKIRGIAADLFRLELKEEFDVILFDMILHGFENQQRMLLLRKFSNILNPAGIMCIVAPDKKEAGNFFNILKSIDDKWRIIEEITIHDVPRIAGEVGDFTFHIIIVKKANNEK